jgi:hypothetical protein
LTQVNQPSNSLDLAASNGGYLDLHALATLSTASGRTLVVQVTDYGSVIDLSSLHSGVGIAMQLQSYGAIILAGPGEDNIVSFSAKFDNADGPLEVISGGQIVDEILPSDINAWQSFSLDVPENQSVEFLPYGLNSSVELSSYSSSIPEPGSLAMVVVLGAAMLRRRRTR